MSKFDEELVEVTRDYLGGIGQGPFCLYSVLLALTRKHESEKFTLKAITLTAVLFSEEILIERYMDILAIWELIGLEKIKNQLGKVEMYSITLLKPQRMTKKFFSQKLTDMAHRDYLTIAEYEKILTLFESLRTGNRKPRTIIVDKPLSLWGPGDFAKYIIDTYKSLPYSKRPNEDLIENLGLVSGRVSRELLPHFINQDNELVKKFIDHMRLEVLQKDDLLFLDSIFRWIYQKKFLEGHFVTHSVTADNKDWPVYLPRFKQWSKVKDFLIQYKDQEKTPDELRHWLNQLDIEEKAIKCKSQYR